MDEINLIFSLVGFIAISAVGIQVFFSILTSKFPPVSIEVRDRGYKKERTYRLYGYTILKNNILKLLLNDYRTLMVGDIRTLTKYKKDAAFLGILPMGTRDVYEAVERFDFLVALTEPTIIQKPTGRVIQQPTGNKIKVPTGNKIKVKNKEKDEMVEVDEFKEVPEMVEVQEYVPTMLSENKPIIYIDGKTDKDKKRVASFAEGVLIPIRMIESNHHLKEEDITNAKEICGRFIMNEQANSKYAESINPFVHTILAYLPIFLIIIALGVVCWLSWAGMSDVMTKMMAMYQETLAHSKVT